MPAAAYSPGKHSIFAAEHHVCTACVGENGISDFETYATGYFEAAQPLLIQLLDLKQGLTQDTLVYPIFDPLARSAVQTALGETAVFLRTTDELLYCKGSDADGRGLYTSEGFVVLTGSSGRKEVVASSVGTARERMRLNLIQAGILRIEGDRVVFQKDHLFPSPSAAAIALQGRNANGWTEWRTKDGRTLDEVQRQFVATS